MSLQDIQVKKIDLITETRPLDVELEIAVDVLCEGIVKVGDLSKPTVSQFQ